MTIFWGGALVYPEFHLYMGLMFVKPLNCYVSVFANMKSSIYSYFCVALTVASQAVVDLDFYSIYGRSSLSFDSDKCVRFLDGGINFGGPQFLSLCADGVVIRRSEFENSVVVVGNEDQWIGEDFVFFWLCFEEDYLTSCSRSEELNSMSNRVAAYGIYSLDGEFFSEREMTHERSIDYFIDGVSPRICLIYGCGLLSHFSCRIDGSADSNISLSAHPWSDTFGEVLWMDEDDRSLTVSYSSISAVQDLHRDVVIEEYALLLSMITIEEPQL